MFSKKQNKKPKISIIVIFHNMQREAKRTLYSLTSAYQKNVVEDDYEVIVIDSNSTQPLLRNWVQSIQTNFRYLSVQTDWPSPCRALNIGIEMSKSDHVVCMIDGARILSPGIISKMITVNSFLSNSFIQTIGMHIGDELQNIAVEHGYNQDKEDELISAIDWRRDGYSLFSISCLAGSSKAGFLGPVSESNCFSSPKSKLLEIGGFNEGFKLPGGGLVNLDVFNQMLKLEELTPVMLLGEASFHQFHNGVATNVPRAAHPMADFLREYRELYGSEYRTVHRNTLLFGDMDDRARRFI